MLNTRGTDEDCVPVLALHQAVVRDPAEGDLRERQVVLLGDLLDLRQCFEVWLVPITLTVVLYPR